MEYYIWVETVEQNGKKAAYKKSFGLDEYSSIYKARKSALNFAQQKIEEGLQGSELASCIVEIIASLEPNNELLIFSKKALSENKSVGHQASLPETQIHKNLIKELEIYREENIQCDSTMSPMGGFVIK